ncbi:hypothetical protein EAG_11929 [Camponotus floridanus]|uniref:Uncharacterized protein n=1 Tax=Camponotus floridanus TaxID=104421 RepID=E2A8J0_CAMFO|nr:hypothetical protein EAG_11929 [Camponotus floridanus]
MERTASCPCERVPEPETETPEKGSGRGRVRATGRALATRSYRRDISARSVPHEMGHNPPPPPPSPEQPPSPLSLPPVAASGSHHDFVGGCGLDQHATSVTPTTSRAPGE